MVVDRAVETLYLDGIKAVRSTAATYSDGDWARPACGVWSATDLAGHLVTVVGWYHDWLDRAVAEDASPAFPATELDAHAAADLAALPPGTGPERIEEFGWRAAAYRTRVHALWDRPYGYPRGTVTAGVHFAVAAWEWHVHAWDLATAVGRTHRPDNAGTLYTSGLACIRVATGAELPADPGDPWDALLRRTGRAA